MDGNQYLKIWSYFKNGGEYKIDFPFNGRVLFIWIASLLPDALDAFQSFISLNYFFGLATLYLLFFVWNKLAFPVYQCFFLLVYLCLHWSGIIRQYMIDPVGVDIPYLFCLSIFMYLVLVQKYKYLFLIVLLGVATKEALLPFVLLLLLIKIIQKKLIFFEGKKIHVDLKQIDADIKYIVLALLAGIACKFLIELYYPPLQTGRYKSSLVMVVYYGYLVLKDPTHIPDWITGIILFFGPLLYPFLKDFPKQLIPHGVKEELFLFALLGILLAILGGGDHTRIAFLSFPFFFTYVLFQWKNDMRPFHWIIYMLSMLYLTKCWLYMPTPTVSWEIFSRWYPEYSSFILFIPELVVGICSIIILYFYDKTRRKKEALIL